MKKEFKDYSNVLELSKWIELSSTVVKKAVLELICEGDGGQEFSFRKC